MLETKHNILKEPPIASPLLRMSRDHVLDLETGLDTRKCSFGLGHGLVCEVCVLGGFLGLSFVFHS